MSRQRHTKEFKIEAIKQVTERGHPVAESSFQLLKRERIKWRIYPTGGAARSDVFDYIEMYYNPGRRHGTSDDLSVEYKRRYLHN